MAKKFEPQNLENRIDPAGNIGRCDLPGLFASVIKKNHPSSAVGAARIWCSTGTDPEIIRMIPGAWQTWIKIEATFSSGDSFKPN